MEDVPEQIQAVYREEMEMVRGFFGDRLGYEATDFTVLVGSPDALEAVYMEVTGGLPPKFWTGGGHVFTGRDRITFVVVEHHLPLRWDTIAHEYVHVLQHHLGGWGGSRHEGISLGGREDDYRVASSAPAWQKEGFAVYGNYLYAATRPERPSFIPYTLAPYSYVQCNPLGWDDPVMEMKQASAYELVFLASIFMMEDLPAMAGISIDEGAWLDYWKLLADVDAYWFTRQVSETHFESTFVLDWQPAFQKAFGISVDDFHAAFGEWVRSDVIAERADRRVSYDGCHSYATPETGTLTVVVSTDEYQESKEDLVAAQQAVRLHILAVTALRPLLYTPLTLTI